MVNFRKLSLNLGWAIARDLCSFGPTWEYAWLEEREALSLPYRRVAKEGEPLLEIDPSVFKVGYTSYSPGEISGIHNLHNVTLSPRGYQVGSYQGRSWLREGEWIVTLGCGTQRLYTWMEHAGSRWWWTVTKELRPDGNRVLYEYDAERRLKQVTLKDSSETISLLNYALEYQPNQVTATASNGQKVQYQIQNLRQRPSNRQASYHDRLVNVEAEHLIPTSYGYRSYGDLTHIGKIDYVAQPNNRSLQIDYNSAGQVKHLKAPVGSSSTPVIFASFHYAGKTAEWRGEEGQLTRYQLDDNQRVACIQKCLNQIPYSETRYFWGREGKAAGNLTAIGLYDPQGNMIQAQQRSYDERGNTIYEKLEGNLSGRRSDESYAIHRTFLPVFNVVSEERGDDGSKTEYRYQAGTNLLIAKLRGTTKRIARDFFAYDQFANLIQQIQDNGSGDMAEDLSDVTVRTIKQIQPIVTPLSPAFGQPEIIWEKIWENGQEQLLRKTHNHYDPRGYLCQQDHYDANEEQRYSLYFSHDAAGRLLEKTDALGRKTRHTYDVNHNLISRHDLQTGLWTEYVYDFANRLIKEIAHHPHQTYETSHRYDLSSRKVATVDPFGHETRFSYDTLGRLITITHPSVDGQAGVETFTYDLAGHQTSVQDVLGHTTHTSYTVRGQPIQITYSDGSSEQYQYNGNGLLAQHTAVNGVITTIYYDECLRPARKCFSNAENSLLYETTATYQGEQIASETDANGILTHYSYDGAGRLVETRKQDQRTTYAYDSLGRPYKTTAWLNPTSARVTIRNYDLLDRLTEERIEDLSGTVFECSRYGYDLCGNRNSLREGNSLTQIEYDSRNRPICVTDPLGHKTITEYEEGPNLRVIETDPLGRQTVTLYDALDRVIEIQRKNSLGQICARSQHHYDLAGQQLRKEETVLAPDLPSYQIVTQWLYDEMGHLIALTEAVGTPEQKTTTHLYNPLGQKHSTHLPNGAQLIHEYDDLGRLQRFHASDQSFDYTYHYDPNHNLTTVRDSITQTETQRSYDAYNQITRERLANGLELHYSYDTLGRLQQIQLPDQTGIAYAYNPAHLKSVQRLSNNPYTHHYDHYDLSGNLLTERNPLGATTYEWTPLHQAQAIRSAYFTELLDTYDPVGNLLHKTRQGQTSCRYTYDDLNQLTTESITGLPNQTYLHDSLYNRRKRNTTEHTINHLNQLLSQGDTRYTYNANGELISQTNFSDSSQYTYDALGRLTSLTHNGERYEYQYDAFNRRIKKITPQGEEHYLYIDQNEIGMVNSQGAITQLRVLGSGKGAEIGSAIAIELEGQIYIPYHDHAGNPSVLVDLATREIAEKSTYTAFGETSHSMGAASPWRFSSKRYDPESGWIYFGRRYYDPSNGRWTTPDPRGFADGPNLYAYVHNNPLTHYDLYGLASIPGPATGSCGVAPAQTRDKPVAASSRPTSGGRRQSNSGTTSRKCGLLPGAGTREIHSRDLPGVSLKVAAEVTGRSQSGDLLGCQLTDREHESDFCLPSTTAEYCGVTLRTDTSSSSAFAETSLATTVEVAPWVGGGVAVRGVVRVWRWVRSGSKGWEAGRKITRQLIQEVKSKITETASKISHITQRILNPNPLNGTCYTPKVINDMRLNPRTALPDFHGFPKIVDNYAKFGRSETFIGHDGVWRTKVTLPGGYQGRNGHFEWIIEPDRTINHRIFIPGE